MESYNVPSFVTGFSHLVKCLQGPSMLHLSGLHSFPPPNNNPLDAYTTLYLSTLQFIGICLLPVIYFLTIMYSVSMNIHVQAFIWTYAYILISLECTCRDAIAELHRNSVLEV